MAQRLHLSKNEPSGSLVVGPVGYDSIITPTQEGEYTLGGAGAYAALASSYFAPTQLVAAVGEDFSQEYMEAFKNRNVDLSGLKWEQGKTFFWKGRYFEDFNKRETLQLDLNVLEKFSPKIPDEFKNSSYVSIGTIDPDLQLNAIEQLTGKPFIVIDTIDHWIKMKREALIEVLKRCDLLLINDSEGCVLAQEASIVAAGYKLRQMGVKSVIIKKGEHGSMLFHEKGLFSMPPYPVSQMKDPTGAGDTFIGAFTGYLAAVNDTSFFNIKHAMAYATVLASLSIEGLSCTAIEDVEPKVIEERYEALINMMTF